MGREFLADPVLVTGGTGYIGGRVIEYLLKNGHDVTIASRNPSRFSEGRSVINVLQLPWSDESGLINILRNFTTVIHAAGLNAEDCAKSPMEAFNFNGMATLSLARACRKAGVSRLIYLSTVHVYRAPLIGVMDEETPLSNIHPYATSHSAGEWAVVSQGRESSKLNSIVLRLSNIVGAPMTARTNCWALVAQDLCRQLVTSKKIVLRANHSIQRDFIPMSQFCKFLELLVRGENQGSDIINVVSGQSITLSELACLIAERGKVVLGKKVEIDLGSSIHCAALEPLKLSSKSEVVTELMSLDKLRDDLDDLLLKCYSWFGN